MNDTEILNELLTRLYVSLTSGIVDVGLSDRSRIKMIDDDYEWAMQELRKRT